VRRLIVDAEIGRGARGSLPSKVPTSSCTEFGNPGTPDVIAEQVRSFL